MGRTCTFTHPDGRSCGARPLTTGSLCFWHSPDKTDDAKEASRLGGLRRRREKTLSGAYDVAGLGDVPAIRRVLEIALCDVLGLDSHRPEPAAHRGGSGGTRLLEAEELASLRFDSDEDAPPSAPVSGSTEPAPR